MKPSNMDYIIFNLKKIPIEEVYHQYIGGELRKQSRHLVARCTFHGGLNGDKHPSLVIYPDKNSWFCFGCSKGGNVINLAANALEVSYIEAANIMVRDFDIQASEIDETTSQKLKEAHEYKDLQRRYKIKENEAYQRLASLYRKTNYRIDNIKTPEDLEIYGELFHISEVLLDLLETLRCGSPEEKLAVLKDQRVRRWCGW